MAANALVQTRIDADVRDRASAVLEGMGLTVSDAVRILLTRSCPTALRMSLGSAPRCRMRCMTRAPTSLSNRPLRISPSAAPPPGARPPADREARLVGLRARRSRRHLYPYRSGQSTRGDRRRRAHRGRGPPPGRLPGERPSRPRRRHARARHHRDALYRRLRRDRRDDPDSPRPARRPEMAGRASARLRRSAFAALTRPLRIALRSCADGPAARRAFPRSVIAPE